ncbi:ABC transporter ATP-binding protein [Lawsonibacter celer]|uniref:ABC transporter ATP-binding protein n=1 Tax=Lawsonibacter celer TaxID=2986526 RepID=UPI001646F09B|nr:ABC transporter ATP-binding protein [Lawsonibacter celer]
MLQLFLTHLRGYGKQAVKAPIMMILEVICELTLPLVMSKIVDEAIPSGDVAYIFKLGALMLALAAVSMTCGVLGAKYASYASQGFGGNLRQTLFDKIQTFSFADIDRFSSASLITRITNDVNNMTMMLAMGLRMLVRAPVMLVAALVISVVLNARLALVLAVVIPLMVLAIGVVMKVCTKLFEAMQKKIDALNNTLQENLVAIRVVKAFVRGAHERQKFKKANDELTKAGLNVGMKIVAILPVMMLAMNGATVAVLYFGGKMVMGATFDLGQLQAFLNYIFQILMSVMMVAMSLLQLSRSQACAHRINEVLNAQPDIEDQPQAGQSALPAPRGKVEFQDVSFKYVATGTGDDVLSHVSFSVEPGQFVAIVGGTGTGKSSLVNLIPRFYDVTGGAVLLDGVDVRNYPLEELRSRIGMVLQTNVLFSGTIRENLLWGREDATEEELVQAAKDAQAYDFIMALPNGFDTRLDQGGVNVSGGQKQRLCIARAMLRKPAVLILDDSTSAVDSATEAAIRESFHRNLAGTTVIIIAQRISSVQYADEILVLDDDHIAGRGTHEELLASNPIYQEIYQSQQEGVSA